MIFQDRVTVIAGMACASVVALAGCGVQPGTTAGPAASSPPGAAGACSPDVTIDGFSDVLDKTTFGGTYVGNLSALAAAGPSVFALSDRSALFTLDATTLRPTAVAALHDEDGDDEDGDDLDSEAMALERDGTLLITLGDGALDPPLPP